MKILNQILITILSLTCLSFTTLGQNERNGYVTVNDSVKLYFEFYGHGKDTVVISDGQFISQYLKDYSGKLTLLTFDVRDRGRSSTLKTENAISIQDNLEDVEAIRKYFRILKINLLGWSYMGAMGAMYASKYPENTKSLIMMTPMPMTKKSSKPMTKPTDFSQYNNDLNDFVAKGGKESDPTNYSRLFWRRLFAPSVHDLSKLDEYVARMPINLYNERPSNAYTNVSVIFGKLGDWDFTEIATKIPCRTLVIYGISDTIPIENAKDWSKNIKNSRYLEFSQSGHLLFGEETSKWIRTMEKFFRGDWPDKSIAPKR